MSNRFQIKRRSTGTRTAPFSVSEEAALTKYNRQPTFIIINARLK